MVTQFGSGIVRVLDRGVFSTSMLIMWKLDLELSDIGVKIGGRIIRELRYADDTTLLAQNMEDLEK